MPTRRHPSRKTHRRLPHDFSTAKNPPQPPTPLPPPSPQAYAVRLKPWRQRTCPRRASPPRPTPPWVSHLPVGR
ncbi:unnamed protein product [Spirodela intermedia]|uniref:Uncharacterized protein n=1 Tax=Spirodela intermedia TaxID=51605 RepID=A0A7I8ICH2_SPIIN|nr:unnamed protein product [Spirodela intermedia]CAA6655450.1 unnamed protein product [Spirodela intermedia]